MDRQENAVMTDLANKIALVTGASRGMGRATAMALAAAGARVIVHYGRNADEAKAVVDQIRSRKKLQCLISVGNRSLCECLSTMLPFTLHISNYVSIAHQDKGTADYGRLSAADARTVDQCVADNH